MHILRDGGRENDHRRHKRHATFFFDDRQTDRKDHSPTEQDPRKREVPSVNGINDWEPNSHGRHGVAGNGHELEV